MSDHSDIIDGLKLLNPEGPFEVRVFGRDGKPVCRRFAAGKWALAAKHAADLDKSGDYSGVYCTFNPLRSATGGAACDEDVLRRTRLYLDIDPDRIDPDGEIITGIPATDKECESALALTDDLTTCLIERGWHVPLTTFTGNGYALYFGIDLPNDDNSAELVRRILAGLAQKFDRVGASLDLSVSNAARVTRIPGTTNRKGAAMYKRPHRRAEVLAPRGSGVITAEELRRLADELSPPKPPKPPGSYRGSGSSGLLAGEDFDRNGPGFDEILEPHGWTLVRGTPDNGYWRRPGKTEDHSASTRRRGKQFGEPVLRVFSSNAHPLQENKTYGKFRTLAFLEHRGDVKAAARRLYAAGYGERKNGDRKKASASQDKSKDGKPSGEQGEGSKTAPDGPEAENDIFPALPFPVHLLPGPMREYAAAGAQAIGCDVILLAAPALTVAGGLVGTARGIRLKRSWTEFPAIWTAVIASASSKKSPPYKATVRPLLDLQEQIDAQHAEKWNEWQAKHAEWKNNKDPEKGPPPEEPKKRELFVSDVTLERLGEILLANKRGALFIRDELSMWFNSFARYKPSGSDLPGWLELWSAGCLKIHRKMAIPRDLFVREAICSVGGTIQPAVLTRILESEAAEAGLPVRFLLAMPTASPSFWSESEIPEAVETNWSDCCAGLVGLQGKQVLRLDSDSKAAWVDFHDRMERRADDAEGIITAVVRKMTAYAARLAVLHRLCDRDGKADPNGVAPIPIASMLAGIGLAEWFLTEWERVHGILSRGDNGRLENLLGKIRRRWNGRVTVRQLQRSNQRRYRKSDDAEAELKNLIQSGFGKWDHVGQDMWFVLNDPDPSPEACDSVTRVTTDEAGESPETGTVCDTPKKAEPETCENTGNNGDVSHVSHCHTGIDAEPETIKTDAAATGDEGQKIEQNGDVSHMPPKKRSRKKV